MGFYLRKSFTVGPTRFNLSKSGIGVSTGIRGFRIGSGPRGNYVHMGRHGVYYRATLGVGSTRKAHSASTPSQPSVKQDSMREIESGGVEAMRDSSSVELLNELDRKKKRMKYGPLAIWFGGLVALLALGLSDQVWVPWLVVALAICIVVFAYHWDQLKKTVVLLYDLEPEVERVYQSLHDAFDSLMDCASAWHVEAEGQVEDWKRSAGATSVIRRQPIRPSKSSPPFVKTNVETPIVPVGRQTLYFFPDRILVFEPKGVGAVGYRELMVERSTGRFIEDGTLPHDAKVVDRTWKYVNKRGGPDKRFKDNRELPIALYEYIHLKSESGLNELVQFSRPDVARAFEAALQASRATLTGSAAVMP